jgi:hypothetical protein
MLLISYTSSLLAGSPANTEWIRGGAYNNWTVNITFLSPPEAAVSTEEKNRPAAKIATRVR